MDNNYIYTPLTKPIPITEQQWPDGTLPLVTTQTITHMHVPFIRDCIEGILMQKTTFPVQVVIHDDASTDKTADIVREYEAKHPCLIKAIYQTDNQFSKPGKGTMRQDIQSAVLGKYIALCEGDDYWTDPLKLQKQVEFLEGNDAYGLVHGNCHFYYHDKDKWEYGANKHLTNKKTVRDKKELFYRLVDADYKIRAATVLFRKKLLQNIRQNDIQLLMGDTPLWLDLSQITKFKYIDEIFAVYRISANSASRPNNRLKRYRFILSMAEMRVYYCNKHNYAINKKLKERYNSVLLTYLLFDPKFKPYYPLFEPNIYQRFKIKNTQLVFWRFLFKAEWYLTRYTKAVINKLG